jgi:trimethyllysine dioxygenase
VIGVAGARIVSVAGRGEGCLVELSGLGSVVVSWRWLRDHDESEVGLDPLTGQRRLSGTIVGIEPASVASTATSLTVSWADGAETEHRADTLRSALVAQRSLAVPNRDVPTVGGPGVELWPRAPGDRPPPLEHGDVVDDDASLWELLDRMRRWGWGELAEVPPGGEPIEALASRIGYVRRTVFGDVWELAADLSAHADTAYGVTFLGPHTDGTYSHDGPGVQLFSCQERRGDGGDSILVDGFAVAADMVAVDPDGARLLASVDVPSRYVEPGVSLRAERPVLRCDQDGRLVQVSFNAYDREPFLLGDPGEWDRFVDAYDRFGALVADESRWLRLEWRPGHLLLFDNWRVLHGRGAYTGSRRFLGCYLNHEDLESAWRVHGVL